MKLQLLSDLHLERHPDFVPDPAPGADILVLAGDIGSYQRGSRLMADDFGLSRFSPLSPGSPWKTVLYIPGNHEFDGLDFARTSDRLRTLCAQLGIIWLERRSIVIDGVRFVGSTLWTDFDSVGLHSARVRHHPEGEVSLTTVLRQREKAFRAANHYLSTNTTLMDGKPLLAADMRGLGLESQAWLREALAVPHAGPTVVVTHFAPSLRSHDPRYGITPGTAGFCNALDDLLPAARLWLHGHLHCPVDYVAETVTDGEPRRCRVIANPLGYLEKGEQAGFRPAWAIDVPAD